MTSIFHIAKNTWRECLRQPIFVILMICTLSIIGLYPAMALFVFRSQEKMVIDGSLATIMTFGLVAAVLCSSHTVSREINTGTVLLILSKPVSRDAFIVAKILGILTAMTLFAWTAAIAALIALKAATDQFRFDPYLISGIFGVITLSCIVGGAANYYGRRSFSAACAKSLWLGMTVLGLIALLLPEWDSNHYKWAAGSSYFDANVCREVILIIFAVWAMSTLSTALSTRFNLMSNMTICMVIFVFGLMSDWIRAGVMNTELSDIQTMMHSWYYALFPMILLFWVVTTKRFAHRKNPKTTIWEVHLIFAVLFGGVLTKAVSDHMAQVQLTPTSLWMNVVAKALFKVKAFVAEVFYAAIPNWQQFWLADAIAGNKTIPITYVGSALGYVVMFIISFTILAILMFSDRDVGAQETN